jgi:Tol biopolymer transport system component
MHRPRAHGSHGPAALLLVVALAATFGLLIAPAAYGTFPGRNGMLAVGGDSLSFGCRNLTIHVMRSDGKGFRPLTPSGKCATSAQDRWAPDWSADGTRLLFLDFNDEPLGVMSAGGADAGRFGLAGTMFDVEGMTPSFAPDGQRAVLQITSGLSWYLWIAALDGRPARRIHAGEDPRWSPDGRMIAYTAQRGLFSTHGLRILDVATERQIIARNFTRSVRSVDWSPDGRRLLMVMEDRHSGRSSLATVIAGDATSRPVGIPLPRRFRSRWDVGDAVWSPDGRRIAFLAFRSFDYDLYRASLWVMRASGGHVRLIRRGAVSGNDFIAESVSWQPIVP